MSKVGPAERPNRGGPPRFVVWLIKGLLLLLVGVLLLHGLGSFIAASGYLVYVATRATVFDVWGVLNIISALLSFVGMAGAGLALWRRQLVVALAFTVLALPASIVIMGSQCDTEAGCQIVGWAALPPSAFTWQVRLRPVTDPNEARSIASGALAKARDGHSPFKAKRFADHWIVSTISQEGWPGAHAVRIDTRTAKTSLVACPQDQIQCGMERPVVSDGRHVFHNSRLGLAATFPPSRAVCTIFGDGDEHSGLYAMARDPADPCDLVDDSPSMGVELSRYRLNGCRVVEAPTMPWASLSPETAKLFRNPAPKLAGWPSQVCELRRNGMVQISVYARPASGPNGALYNGFVVTTPDRLADDIRSFEAFLATVRIGSP